MQLVALNELGQAGRAASVVLAASATAQRNAALQALARRLRRPLPALDAANALDLQAAVDLDAPLRDRLKLDAGILATLAEGCEQIAALPDPVGEMTNLRRRPRSR